MRCIPGESPQYAADINHWELTPCFNATLFTQYCVSSLSLPPNISNAIVLVVSQSQFLSTFTLYFKLSRISCMWKVRDFYIHANNILFIICKLVILVNILDKSLHVSFLFVFFSQYLGCFCINAVRQDVTAQRKMPGKS